MLIVFLIQATIRTVKLKGSCFLTGEEKKGKVIIT